MERRYLVAALAIIATFAVFSRGLRTLERLSLSYGRDVETNAKAKCNADAAAASRLIGRVRTHLRPGYPEEAQLLAEMNLPVVMAQAQAAEQIARQNMAAAQCARAKALRDAERAQREATRMRERMARSNRNAPAMPIAWEANASDVGLQVRAKTAALAEQIAAQSVRLQMAADRMGEISVGTSDPDVVRAGDADVEQDSRAHCNAEQASEAVSARTRAMVHQVVHALGYR